MDYVKILKDLDVKVVKDEFQGEITNINIDSRKIKENGCFVAIDGLTVDGHKFINKAYENGAKVFIVEKEVIVEYNDVTVLQVTCSRKALVFVAKELYNNVDEKLKLIGVTGTNGKTSTTFFISHVLNYLKIKAMSIGTLGVKVDNREIDLPITASTTPEFTELLDIFTYAEKDDVSVVAMEVSSHSLVLDKVYGLNFEASIFTNLTQDHLDFHKTMQEYLEAKCLLFKQSKLCIINIDDMHSDEVLKSCTGEILTYGIDKLCDYRAENVVLNSTSIEYDLKYKDGVQHIKVNVPGRFTVYNTLGAIVALHQTTSFTLAEISEAISTCKGIPGRVQTLESKQGISLIVDYAHTPDALEKLIITARETTDGDIITVFGCGGDRDKTKRSIMGEIATRLSDFTVITSDNPRFEKPEDILSDIESGIVGENYEKVEDRESAIKLAIQRAKKGDKILVAGKGHEDYQIVGDTKHHFDDLEVAKKLLEENDERYFN